jgi:ketosteroid isomerase-like protein
MRKQTFVVLSGFVFLLLMLFVACTPVETKTSSYGEDRALIEDLQARYMFALDAGDMDTYVKTFTEDGVLDIGDGPMRGRAEILKILGSMPRQNDSAAAKEQPKLRRATGRHNITNIIIKVDGDKAQGRSYWFHYGNNNPQRTPILNSYGHYEDEMVKVNGQWLFSKRYIYNEQVDKWASKPGNSAW